MSEPPRVTEPAQPSPDGVFGGSPLTPVTAKRVAMFGSLIAVLFGILIMRLWFLQVVGAEDLEAQATVNTVRTINIPAPRGDIVDRNGKALARSRMAWDVVALPQDLENEQGERTLRKLARALDENPAKLKRLMAYGRKRTPYKSVVLKADLDESDPLFLALNERIREFPGIRLERNQRRSYPDGQYVSHVLGWVGQIPREELERYQQRGYRNDAIVGLSGLERRYEEFLRGTDGERRVEVDAAGRPTNRGIISERPAKPGRTLKTTIDLDVQKSLADALRLQVETKGSRNSGAGGVVMDITTGEVVALASYPQLDPDAISRGRLTTLRKYRRDPREPYFNRATAAYPPASTFKPITAVAALNSGAVTPETFKRSGPKVWLYGRWWFNFRRQEQGDLQLRRALALSSDTYFYQVGASLYEQTGKAEKEAGHTPLWQWARDLGLGERTGIDLIPGESASNLPDRLWKTENISPKLERRTWDEWRPGDTINMSVGQGYLTASPLQMARAYAALLNGGRLLTPTVGWKVVDPVSQAPVSDLAAGRPERQIPALNDGVLDAVTDGLLEATSVYDGTAVGAFGRLGGLVAGKTGTAENSGADHAWFVGYGPALPDTKPKYVVAVVVERAGLGGGVAAPAACRAITVALQTDPNRCGNGVAPNRAGD